MKWTEERCARLRVEWMGGDAASVIAQRLSREWSEPLTKSAIISRANQLHLPARQPVHAISDYRRHPKPNPGGASD